MGWFVVREVERYGVFCMKRWLEVFREDITFVVLTCDSPNPHLAVNVILSDCVMSSVDGTGVLVHCGLCCDVFRGLLIC